MTYVSDLQIEHESYTADVAAFKARYPQGCTHCFGSGWSETDRSTGVCDFCPHCLDGSEESRCPLCGEEVQWSGNCFDVAHCKCGYNSEMV